MTRDAFHSCLSFGNLFGESCMIAAVVSKPVMQDQNIVVRNCPIMSLAVGEAIRRLLHTGEIPP